jgi:hypothetical protein
MGHTLGMRLGILGWWGNVEYQHFMSEDPLMIDVLWLVFIHMVVRSGMQFCFPDQ